MVTCWPGHVQAPASAGASTQTLRTGPQATPGSGNRRASAWQPWGRRDTFGPRPWPLDARRVMACPPAFPATHEVVNRSHQPLGQLQRAPSPCPDSTAAPPQHALPAHPSPAGQGTLRPCAVTVSAFWPGWGGSGLQEGHGCRFGVQTVRLPGPGDGRARVIALDRTTVAALRAHRHRQQAERAAAGERWRETGYVFTTPAGTPLPPDGLTRLVRRLVRESGLPPVTLHGLRHGAATLALAAGTDLKIVHEPLGHSTITLTADTYTSVLPETAYTAAEDAARLLFPPRESRARALSGLRHPARIAAPGPAHGAQRHPRRRAAW